MLLLAHRLREYKLQFKILGLKKWMIGEMGIVILRKEKSRSELNCSPNQKKNLDKYIETNRQCILRRREYKLIILYLQQ